jgi:hypothetical protein
MRIQLNDPSHTGGSNAINCGTVVDDGTGDSGFATGGKLKVNLNDLNTMTNELYGGQYSTLIMPSGDTSGVTDEAAILIAATALTNSFRLPPLDSSNVATGTVRLGPGTFYITGTTAMLPASPRKMAGFELVGCGRGVTTIDYNPASSQPMFANQEWLNVKFRDLSFTGHDANSDFLWSQEQAALTNIQDYTFADCDWGGSWRTLVRLTGNNNNSEWKFARCTVACNVTNWIYTPPAVSATTTSGSANIAISNTLGQVNVGDTGTFSAAIAPLAANTSYYVVAATTSSFQVATTRGGTPVTFTASATATFTDATDQFLNYWFHQCKFDTGSSPGQWINMNFGGSIKITDCDISGHAPSAGAAYIFNLLGTVHGFGVQNFKADGLRIEHSNANSLLLQLQWSGGTVSFNNLDTSSQAGNNPITTQYVSIAAVNTAGATVEFRNSTLIGQHLYTTSTNNFNFQTQYLYELCTMLENPTAANFIVQSNTGNTSGAPKISFRRCRTSQNATTVGYQEVVDTDLNWAITNGSNTSAKMVSICNAQSGLPVSGGNQAVRLPLGAAVTRIKFWKKSTGVTGAFQYTVQTTEATPTVLAGGASTLMAGSNAGTAIALYEVELATPFVMTTDLARTIAVVDTLAGGRTSGAFGGQFLLVEYIG